MPVRIVNAARYIFAFLVLATYPPSLLLWLAIHPFAGFWRKLGPGWTYGVLSVPVAGYMAGVWVFRDHLLVTEWGNHAIMLCLAAVCLAAAMYLSRERRKYLNFRVLSGVPELSKEQYPGTLLTDGIYARIRNPRYVEVFFWVSGYALIANYVLAYVVVVMSIPVMYLVVLLEERELRERFGATYDDYCRRVPRFLPKRRQ